MFSTVNAIKPTGLLLQMRGPPESPCNRNKRHLVSGFPCQLLKDVTYLAKAALVFVKFGTIHVSFIKILLPSVFALFVGQRLLYGFLQHL